MRIPPVVKDILGSLSSVPFLLFSKNFREAKSWAKRVVPCLNENGAQVKVVTCLGQISFQLGENTIHDRRIAIVGYGMHRKMFVPKPTLVCYLEASQKDKVSGRLPWAAWTMEDGDDKDTTNRSIVMTKSEMTSALCAAVVNRDNNVYLGQGSVVYFDGFLVNASLAAMRDALAQKKPVPMCVA